MNGKTIATAILLCLVLVIFLLPVLAAHAIYKTIFWLFSGKDESWREYVWKD